MYFVLTEIYETEAGVADDPFQQTTASWKDFPAIVPSGWKSAKSRLCPQLPLLTRSGEGADSPKATHTASDEVAADGAGQKKYQKHALGLRSAGLFLQAFGLSSGLRNNKLCGRHEERIK